MSFFAVENLGVRFGGVLAVDDVSFEVSRGEVFTHHRPERRRQDHDLQPDQPHLPADRGPHRVRGPRGCTGAPHDVAALGIARTFQNIELFEHATVLQNLLIGRHTHRRTNLLERAAVHCRACAAPRSRSARRSSSVIDLLDLAALPRQPGRRPALRRAQGGRAGARARAPSRSCCCSTSRPPASTPRRPTTWRSGSRTSSTSSASRC